MAVAIATPGARAYHTNFQGSCTNEWFATSGVTRSQAQIYAEIGAHEGYQWGGGCWNDNNVDDAPGDPTENRGTRGEGGDCSGLHLQVVVRARAAHRTPASTTTTGCGTSTGRSSPQDFKNGVGLQNLIVSKTALIQMDALASANHVGMIYQANTAYNTDRIVEAKCEACGTGIWTRTYRGDPSYGGVRRAGWSH